MTLYLTLHKTLVFCFFHLEQHCDELFVINITVAINVRFGKVKQNRKFTSKGVIGQLCFEEIILFLVCLTPIPSSISSWEKNIWSSRIGQTDMDLTSHSSVDNFSPSFCRTSCRSGTVMKPWPSLSNTLECNTLLGGQTVMSKLPLNLNYCRITSDQSAYSYSTRPELW